MYVREMFECEKMCPIFILKMFIHTTRRFKFKCTFMKNAFTHKKKTKRKQEKEPPKPEDFSIHFSFPSPHTTFPKDPQY